MYKHLFFDLDNTITRSRSPVEPAMREILSEFLAAGVNIVIVSGARVEQAKKQLDNLPCIYLGQNGNHAHDTEKEKDLWFRELSGDEKKEILDHIKKIPRTWPVKDEHDLVEDRKCQISYSLLGHTESVQKKEEFDPDSSRRRALLQKHPFVSDTVEVKIGGTTCFDYISKGKHKGFNITELLLQKGWKKDECLYFGDALFPGGNDETVVGVIETRPVRNPADTLQFLKGLRF